MKIMIALVSLKRTEVERVRTVVLPAVLGTMVLSRTLVSVRL